MRLTINELSLLKWRDGDKIKQDFNLFNKISDQWLEAGLRVGVSFKELNNEYRLMYNDNKNRCRKVLAHWINNGSTEYPLSWEGLCQLLCDIDEASVAAELRQVLESNGVYLSERS